MRVTVTRIEWDGTMQRRRVDTARRADGPHWEDLAVRALAIPPPYTPAPRTPVYHVSVDDQVMLAAEHDLGRRRAGPAGVHLGEEDRPFHPLADG